MIDSEDKLFLWVDLDLGLDYFNLTKLRFSGKPPNRKKKKTGIGGCESCRKFRLDSTWYDVGVIITVQFDKGWFAYAVGKISKRYAALGN